MSIMGYLVESVDGGLAEVGGAGMGSETGYVDGLWGKC